METFVQVELRHILDARNIPQKSKKWFYFLKALFIHDNFFLKGSVFFFVVMFSPKLFLEADVYSFRIRIR